MIEVARFCYGRTEETVILVDSEISDTLEEAAYRSQMAAYFDAIIQHGEAADILRNLERAIERLAFVRACIIPFTVGAELHRLCAGASRGARAGPVARLSRS